MNTQVQLESQPTRTCKSSLSHDCTRCYSAQSRLLHEAAEARDLTQQHAQSIRHAPHWNHKKEATADLYLAGCCARSAQLPASCHASVSSLNGKGRGTQPGPPCALQQ